MNYKNKLKEILLIKEKNVNNSDLSKINLIKELLKLNDGFSRIDESVAINILTFLGVPKEQVTEFYYNLVKEECLSEPKSYYILN